MEAYLRIDNYYKGKLKREIQVYKSKKDRDSAFIKLRDSGLNTIYLFDRKELEFYLKENDIFTQVFICIGRRYWGVIKKDCSLPGYIGSIDLCDEQESLADTIKKYPGFVKRIDFLNGVYCEKDF